MIKHDVVHGSPEWYMLRCGIPTSSDFGKIITPKTGVLSKQAEKYMHVKLAELCMREPIDTVGSTYWIDRGNELEAAARKEYEFLTGNKVEHGGFITDDLKRWGTSPDGLAINVNRGLELKCPAPQTHIDYALNEDLDDDYRPQVMGQMYIAELDGVDMFAYHPQLKPVLLPIDRDEKYISKLAKALEEFRERMDEKCQKLIKDGYLVIEDQETGEILDYTMAG